MAEEIIEEQSNTTENQNQTPEIEIPTSEVSIEEKLQAELAEMKDKYLRLYSEFENFRKRTAKEKSELIFTASEGVLTQLLPVLDDFERAKVSMDQATEIEPVKEGLELIYQKLFKVLEQKGLKSIDAKGKAFDPDLHEAITQIPAPTEDLKGKVVDEIEKGYYLHEKIIRYSKVVIGN